MAKKLRTLSPPGCRSCGKPLATVHITTYSTLTWKGEGEEGHYEDTGGDAEERCPECDVKWPISDDETAVDFRKSRRARRTRS